ncbi:hypothetical protein [Micromonospora sp. NPDC005305]|uniref:hypothetical protein n=1 Tax=Micromonospora sp. NPDC005305 TaxID=3156875 RepID=UPI0033A8CA1E
MTGTGLRSGQPAEAAGVNLQTLRYHERRGWTRAGHGQREKISSRITVTTALTRIEPRQPTRFEKKRNMPGLYPPAPV